MKTTKIALVIALAAQTFTSSLAAAPDAMKKDIGGFQGEWTMVSGATDGVPIPNYMFNQIRQVFTGDQMTGTISGTMYWKVKFAIDPSKSPKTIDYEIIGGPAKGAKQLGIYELNDDTCKLCVGKLNGERPKNFDATPGTGNTASTWKRAKSAAPTKGT
jgi:uncharacterized protein (TIGR03067 family)